MIENLRGIQETVNFKTNINIRLYANEDCEEYPLHWHAPLEIIMPLKYSNTLIFRYGFIQPLNNLFNPLWTYLLPNNFLGADYNIRFQVRPYA